MADRAWIRYRQQVLVSALFVTCNASVQAGPSEFRITDLGRVTANAMNDLGQVVGQSSAGTPFVWSAKTGFVPLGGAEPLPQNGGGVIFSYPIARDINNEGHIIGDVSTIFDARIALVWTGPDNITYLAKSGSATSASAINRLGTGAAHWDIGHGNGGGVVYTRDRAGNYVGQQLPSLPWACLFPFCYGSNSAPTGVNDANVVVGWSNTLRGDQHFVNEELPFPPVTHAVLWHVSAAEPPSTPELRDLGTLPGAANSEAHAVNNKDVVVGDSDKHAFSWTAASGIVPLDTPAGDSSSAAAINEKNWVVGTLSGSKGGRAALWRSNSEVIDLNLVADLLHSDFSTLSKATDINDLNHIIGSGLARDGSTHAFLLTPIPEPRAWLLTLVGLAAVVSATRGAGRILQRVEAAGIAA